MFALSLSLFFSLSLCLSLTISIVFFFSFYLWRALYRELIFIFWLLAKLFLVNFVFAYLLLLFLSQLFVFVYMHFHRSSYTCTFGLFILFFILFLIFQCDAIYSIEFERNERFCRFHCSAASTKSTECSTSNVDPSGVCVSHFGRTGGRMSWPMAVLVGAKH